MSNSCFYWNWKILLLSVCLKIFEIWNLFCSTPLHYTVILPIQIIKKRHINSVSIFRELFRYVWRHWCHLHLIVCALLQKHRKPNALSGNPLSLMRSVLVFLRASVQILLWIQITCQIHTARIQTTSVTECYCTGSWVNTNAI